MPMDSGSDRSHPSAPLRLLRSEASDPGAAPISTPNSTPICVHGASPLLTWYGRGVRQFMAHLWRADLRGAQLGWIDLQQGNLIAADLRGACLIGANLTGASLIGADLRGADLRRCCLRQCSLWRADLRGADLRGADVIEAGWWSALYSPSTRWDEDLDPHGLGLHLLGDHEARPLE